MSLALGHAKDRPNILFILLDDLGKEWISSFGAEDIKTPNIDAMAKGGMRFENFYSMPQCTPTRMSFMTGQYPFRHGWVNHWDVPRWGGGCHYDWNKNPSIARVLQKSGYKTAVAGKWQLNDFRVQPDAMTKHGFDDYCMWTGYEEGNPPSAERYWDPYIHTKDGSKTYKGAFGEDIFTEFMIDFMKKNIDSPMFMYYAMCLPHTPFVSTPLDPKASTKYDQHKAMVKYVDFIVGLLLNSLNHMGLREKTIVILTTDNGTTPSLFGNQNGRLVRGGKMKTTENGINGPFIVNGPGLVPSGVVSNALCDVVDLLPTFAELAGAELPKDIVFDGISFADVLLGKEKLSKRKWIMSMGGKNNAALTDRGVENQWVYRDRVIRNEKYKLWIGPDKRPVKLVDLEKDILEKVNLIGNPEYSKIVDELFVAVADHYEQDLDPIYTPLGPQDWDVKIGEKSYEWKSGQPNEQVHYVPDTQLIRKNKKNNLK